MFCTTECWNCEDKKCEHYVSKQYLYFENLELKKQKDKLLKILINIYKVLPGSFNQLRINIKEVLDCMENGRRL